MLRLLAILASAATPLAAEVPFLDLPIDCDLGRTCFIEDYVDADPGPGQADYTCGPKSRDGHRGVDIALLSFEAMDRGVNVLAAADGVVDALRDGVQDRPWSAEIAAEMRGRECGNAVRIRHENGLHTLYCHLRQGSVAVTQGQSVAAGQPIATVGLSGQTNYPHVHLGVLRDGATVDPFAPDAAEACGTAQDTLWRDPPSYDRTGLFTAGFSDAVPGFDAVRDGSARRSALAPNDPMVLYGHVFHAEPGDMLAFRVTGAGDTGFEDSFRIEEGRAQMFRAFGKRAPDGGWQPGAYRGYIRLTRGDRVLAVRHADVNVTQPDR